MSILDIWLLLAVVLAAAAFAALYEWAALKLGLFPPITQEVRLGERRFPVIYYPIVFFIGVLFGHLFWQ